MNLNLNNKNAIVCGSTSGIGKATAIALSNEGVNVTLIARNESKLKNTINELNNTTQKHSYIVADFNNPSELELQLKKQLSPERPIHILVNNTGGPPGGPIESASLTALETAFRQHVLCNHILVKAVTPSMKKENYGRIINVISTSVKQPLNNLGVSNTIRAAVANWSKTLANELGAFGITVNNVLPGATLTGRLEEIIAAKVEKENQDIETISNAMKREIPSKRFADVSDIANGIVFLSSEAAAYINGVNLPIDGGRTKSL